MNTRVLVIDDEPLARRGVGIHLSRHPEMHLVGEAASGAEGFSLISRLRPDLIFLDIQMPDMSGIDMLRRLSPEAPPAVIFLTAFNKYAIDAFEFEALDYLLKPFEEERFRSAVERAKRYLKLKRLAEHEGRLQAMLGLIAQAADGHLAERFAVRKGRDIAFIPVSDIDWIEGCGDYAGLHVGKKIHLINDSLVALERKLDPKDFIRVHRSSIVRVDRIARIEALPNRDCELTLSDGTCMRVSRTYSGALRALLKSLGI